MKFNVHRVDNMIIQSISLLDQLDKDINTFSMRVRSVRTDLGGFKGFWGQWGQIWGGLEGFGVSGDRSGGV